MSKEFDEFMCNEYGEDYTGFMFYSTDMQTAFLAGQNLKPLSELEKENNELREQVDILKSQEGLKIRRVGNEQL